MKSASSFYRSTSGSLSAFSAQRRVRVAGGACGLLLAILLAGPANRRSLRRLRGNASIKEIDAMNGMEFGRLRRRTPATGRLGGRLTPVVGDYGVDLIARRTPVRGDPMQTDTVKPLAWPPSSRCLGSASSRMRAQHRGEQSGFPLLLQSNWLSRTAAT